jgi:hypothetical protein
MSSSAHSAIGQDLGPIGEIDERDRRAAEQYLVPVETAPGLYHVYSEDGESRYLADVRLGACECPDFEYRSPAGGCKHVRRARMELGDHPIPPADEVDVDPCLIKRLAENLEAGR